MANFNHTPSSTCSIACADTRRMAELLSEASAHAPAELQQEIAAFLGAQISGREKARKAWTLHAAH